VASFENNKYSDVTVGSIPQRTDGILLLVFCGQRDFAQMPFTLRCIQYKLTNVLQDQQCMLGVRSLLVDKKVLFKKKTWPMCCFND